MTDARAASLVGLAQKAGKIASGEELTVQAIRSRKAYLAVIAEDASGNTEKKIRDKALWYEVPAVKQWTKAELGHMIGRGERSCLAVTDPGLADKIRDHLKNGR